MAIATMPATGIGGKDELNPKTQKPKTYHHLFDDVGLSDDPLAELAVPALVALLAQARQAAVRHDVDRRQQRARNRVDEPLSATQ